MSAKFYLTKKKIRKFYSLSDESKTITEAVKLFVNLSKTFGGFQDDFSNDEKQLLKGILHWNLHIAAILLQVCLLIEKSLKTKTVKSFHTALFTKKESMNSLLDDILMKTFILFSLEEDTASYYLINTHLLTTWTTTDAMGKYPPLFREKVAPTLSPLVRHIEQALTEKMLLQKLKNLYSSKIKAKLLSRTLRDFAMNSCEYFTALEVLFDIKASPSDTAQTFFYLQGLSAKILGTTFDLFLAMDELSHTLTSSYEKGK